MWFNKFVLTLGVQQIVFKIFSYVLQWWSLDTEMVQ